jgi:hypothetical protein
VNGRPTIGYNLYIPLTLSGLVNKLSVD